MENLKLEELKEQEDKSKGVFKLGVFTSVISIVTTIILIYLLVKTREEIIMYVLSIITVIGILSVINLLGVTAEVQLIRTKIKEYNREVE